MQIPYLMDGENESQRLVVKDRTASTQDQLLKTGITHYMKAGARIVDAGSGVGVVGEQIARIAETAKQSPELILLDGSQERLHVASQRLADYDLKKSYLTCNLEKIPLPDQSVDYLFCRFVFEYLQNPEQVFREFIRILRHGGKLVIGDLDNNSISHYPLTDELQAQLGQIVSELQSSYKFDFHAGRKLFSYFYANSCKEVEIHLYAHHLFYGSFQEHDDFNWSAKLQRLSELQKKGIIKLDFSVDEFSQKFMAFLRSPGSFSYTPLILVEGIVHHDYS